MNQSEVFLYNTTATSQKPLQIKNATNLFYLRIRKFNENVFLYDCFFA